MRIKKFRGRSIAEVVEQVRRECGPDALILQSRRVRAARWLPFRRSSWLVEVTAAHAEGGGLPGHAPPPAPPDGGASPGPGGGFARLIPPGAAIGAYRAAGAEPPGESAGGEASRTTGSATAVVSSPGPAAPSLPGIEADVKQMKELVSCIWQQVQVGVPVMERETGIPPLYPPGVEPIYRALLGKEVEPSLARCLCDSLLDTAAGKGPGLLRQECGAAVERLLGPACPIELNGRGKVVALAGPTGVGKTTTLAKLAAQFALNEGKRVAFITVDTFRVAAVEQLRTYAEIAEVPCYVARTPEEFAAILGRLAGLDLILVDTAGRSHRDEPRMSELARFWEARRPDEIHLVISATARYSDALEILDRYRAVGFDRLLFTKLDETRHHGLILNASVVARRPLSYITTGQQVPEDIALARAGDLAKLIV